MFPIYQNSANMYINKFPICRLSDGRTLLNEFCSFTDIMLNSQCHNGNLLIFF